MLRAITLLLSLFFSVLSIAQVEYNMQDVLVTDCEGILYDSGGPDGDYGENEEFTFTICPEPSPACIQLDMGTVFIESAWESLYIFDGISIESDTLLLHNGGLAELGVLSAYSGCITIYFQSDVSVQFDGWEANWKCFEEECPTPLLLPSTQDCEGAIPICQSIYEDNSPYVGRGNVSNEINNSISCLGSGERNSVWYKINILETGDLAFFLIPNDLTDDYDWTVFNITNSQCNQIFDNPNLDVSCNYSFHAGITGATGVNNQTSGSSADSNQNATIPVQKGETYVINISQFTPSIYGFTLDFSASTATIGDNIPSMIEFPNQFVEVVDATEIQLHFTEDIQCQSMENTQLQLEGYELTYQTLCNELGYAADFTFAVHPPLEEGIYDLQFTGELMDVCGNTATLNENIAFEADDIVGLPPIHQSAIRLYPNPTSELLFLQLPDGVFSSNSKAQLEVFDLQGRKVAMQILEGIISNEIAIRDYPRGVYFVKVQIGGEVWGEKVVIR